MKKRKITGFHQDNIGDWVADLSCGHTRHMRHEPPWKNRPWVETAAGRDAHLGEEIDCKKCSEGHMQKNELPEAKRRIAEAVKANCLEAAVNAYQAAELNGGSPEDAWEQAVAAIRGLNIDGVLNTLPE